MTNTAVVIGASTGLGRALAQCLARNRVNLILSARNAVDLQTLASTLSREYGVSAIAVPIDLSDVTADAARSYVAGCFEKFPDLDQVYVTAAMIDDRDVGPLSMQVMEEMFDVNCCGICLLLAAFSDRLAAISSNLTVISSIAAIRPRGKNIAYASSKIALEYFAGGLRHFHAKSAIRIQVYRVGYMNTAMTQGKKMLFPIADVANVADHIVENRGKDFGMRYYPGFWSLVACTLRSIPWPLYKRLEY